MNRKPFTRRTVGNGEINLSVGFLEASDSPLLRLTNKVGKVLAPT